MISSGGVWPMVVVAKYIPAGDNRGAGASMGHQVRGMGRGDKGAIVVG